MNHISNLYRLKAQELQEQVNHLEKLLQQLDENQAPAMVFSGTGKGQKAFSDEELEDQIRQNRRTGLFGAKVEDEKQNQAFKDAQAELARRRGAQQTAAPTKPAPTAAQQTTTQQSGSSAVKGGGVAPGRKPTEIVADIPQQPDWLQGATKPLTLPGSFAGDRQQGAGSPGAAANQAARAGGGAEQTGSGIGGKEIAAGVAAAGLGMKAVVDYIGRQRGQRGAVSPKPPTVERVQPKGALPPAEAKAGETKSLPAPKEAKALPAPGESTVPAAEAEFPNRAELETTVDGKQVSRKPPSVSDRAAMGRDLLRSRAEALMAPEPAKPGSGFKQWQVGDEFFDSAKIVRDAKGGRFWKPTQAPVTNIYNLSGTSELGFGAMRNTDRMESPVFKRARGESVPQRDARILRAMEREFPGSTVPPEGQPEFKNWREAAKNFEGPKAAEAAQRAADRVVADVQATEVKPGSYSTKEGNLVTPGEASGTPRAKGAEVNARLKNIGRGAAKVAADLPAMVVGGAIAGEAAKTMGAGETDTEIANIAGSFALPAALSMGGASTLAGGPAAAVGYGVGRLIDKANEASGQADRQRKFMQNTLGNVLRYTSGQGEGIKDTAEASKRGQAIANQAQFERGTDITKGFASAEEAAKAAAERSKPEGQKKYLEDMEKARIRELQRQAKGSAYTERLMGSDAGEMIPQWVTDIGEYDPLGRATSAAIKAIPGGEWAAGKLASGINWLNK